jgi:hypothetical protein
MLISEHIQQVALQKLAGITEGLQQHNYTFYIIDPTTGEFTQYYSGSVISILQQLEKDPENSMIADVLKQQNIGQPNGTGIISFVYDSHIYAFIPN